MTIDGVEIRKLKALQEISNSLISIAQNIEKIKNDMRLIRERVQYPDAKLIPGTDF